MPELLLPRLIVAPRSILALLVALLAAGCDAPPAEFHLNYVEIARQEADIAEIPPEQEEQIATTLFAMFGTPDNPDNPWEHEGAHISLLAEQGFDIDLLKMAAGPVAGDEQGNTTGLYRLHCAHCHGITGDGKGPTAPFLNPYPRDYRQGVFKFKSTELAARPTRADLKRILVEGIPGTAMPSFKLLKDNELEALVEYVKYLSVRGEVEKELIFLTADEGEVPTDPEVLVEEVMRRWDAAEDLVVEPVAPPEYVHDEGFEQSDAWHESVERGRALFLSADTGNCASCHGNLALGDGQLTLFDVWNTDVTPELEALGALPPRNIQPRNLRLGVFRGGRRPVDLYRRIRVGIAGSGMPGVPLKASPEAEQGVSEAEIWDLVNYVKSLQYEALSRPPEASEGGARSRL